MREWRKNNPEKRLEQDRLYKKKFGMNFYERVAFRNAKGKCDICSSTKRLKIDHCHSTGKVRGVLCGSCNLALGLLGDNATAIERALNYLEYAEQEILKHG